MKIIYGASGQPTGSISGTDVFWKDGKHISFLEDDYIYEVEDGEWIGSLVNGVLFNAIGEPQGFIEGCKPAIPLVEPRLKRISPPRLAVVGESVEGDANASIPNFLDGSLPVFSGIGRQ